MDLGFINVTRGIPTLFYMRPLPRSYEQLLNATPVRTASMPAPLDSPRHLSTFRRPPYILGVRVSTLHHALKYQQYISRGAFRLIRSDETTL